MARAGTALAFAVALAAPAGAQDWKGQGRMEGRVVDPEGKPVAGATVKLALPARGGGPTTTTDKNGKWAVGGIVGGRWQIDIEAAGFESLKTYGYLPSESARIKPLEFKLAKPAGPPPVALAAEAAEAAFKDKRYPEARAEYQKVLALRPDLASAIHQRVGLTYVEEKNYAKALEEFEAILSTEPQNAQVRSFAAQAAFEAGLLDKGLELLKGLDESAITNPDTFFNIGINLVNANRPAEAVLYFTKAINLDPNYADGYFRRGVAHLQLGKMPECKADFQKVLELTPTGPQADMARKALEQLK